MKKRLRKKQHRKEFKEIGFDFKICYTSISDTEEYNEMIDNIFWIIEQHGFSATGGFDDGFCNGYMAISSWRINADEMKNKLHTALLNLPGVISVEFGENTDSWYGPFRE